MKKHDTIKDIDVDQKLHSRKEIPEDYHCKCHYCTDNFLGEVYHTPTNQYYTQATRRSYYFPKQKPRNGFDKHICPGHWVGYRWAIQNLTQPGDIVYDPCVGTGTAIVESINHDRQGVGIELEYPEITKRTIDAQYSNGTAKRSGLVIEGDCRDQVTLLKEKKYNGENFDLIITGPPYPVLGGKQSDAPERKSNFTKECKNNYIEYENLQGIGTLKGEEYKETIIDIYKNSIKFLNPGGKFVTLIKDPVHKKSAYLLHKMITDWVLSSNKVKYYGSFIHKHLPSTMFMNTYPKMYPEVKIPLYQTGIILEKC